VDESHTGFLFRVRDVVLINLNAERLVYVVEFAESGHGKLAGWDL